MEWFLLQPEDVLLFRDSRPFTAGEDHRAQGMFPPSPMPIAGAIRSQLLQFKLRQHGKTFAQYVDQSCTDPVITAIRAQYGTGQTFGTLQLRGPLVYRHNSTTGHGEPVFPMPADGHSQGVLAPLEEPPADAIPWFRSAYTGLPPERTLSLLTRQGDAPPPEAGGTGVPDAAQWIALPALIAYLTGASIPWSTGGCNEEKLLRSPTVTEERTGLQRNAQTGAAQAGQLYAMRMHRPMWTPEEEYGLVLACEGAELQEAGLPLGGEMRTVWARRCTISSDFHSLLEGNIREKIEYALCKAEGRFRLMLATPLICTQGWLPALFQGDDAPTLLGAVTGKPLPLGGWDLARKAPKPLYRAIPAGAVYYGQIPGDRKSRQAAVQRFLEQYHFQTTLQHGEPGLEPPAQMLAQMGFGLTLVGSWKPVGE